MLTYISNTAYYKEVLSRVPKVKHILWIVEAGILTDDPEIVEQAMNQFDEVWIGKHCKACKRREYCSDPII